jgi:hypothetical protein
MYSSASFLVGPTIAFIVVGLLALVLRWAFSHGSSIVAKRPRAGTADEYGLLVPVASPPTFVEGEILRRTLEDAGIKVTVTETLDGPRLMVFPEDADRARELIARR